MKKIIVLIVALSFISALAIAGTPLFKNFVYIQNITSPFYGGSLQQMTFTFDSDYDTNQTFYIWLNITSNDTNYPVWMNDFSVNGTLNTVSGLTNKLYLLNCDEKTNGTFLCYNGSSTNQIVLPHSSNTVNLYISSKPNLYPGNYTFQLSTLFFDITPPIIILISPPNNSVIKSGTIIDLNITDDGNVNNAYWSKSKYFFDDFSGGIGNWTPVTGTWNIESNEYSASIGSGDAQSYVNSLTITNASIETKFKILTGTTGKEWVGIHARKASANDPYTTSGYIAYIRYNGEAGIYKAGFGNLVTTNILYDPTSFNTLKFVLSGNVLKVILNEIEIMKTTDNTYTTGNVSLWSGWSTSTHAHFDDVKITDATILGEPYDINTTGWPNGLANLDVFAYDESGNGNHSLFSFNFDNIPPRVENSTVNATVDLGQNATVTVDVEDDSLHTVDTVLVEDYREKYKFDFGNNTSPVENNYTKITRFMTYNASIGYGWVSSPSGDRDRGIGSDLERDLIFDSVNSTFSVDLPNGKYIVTVLLGDKSYPHDKMDVYAEDQLMLNDINTSTGEIKWLNFTVNVNDSQLNIKFVDDGGTDPNWVSEGLIIKSFVQNYKMNEITPMSTYSATIPYPSLGLHSIRYVANDTVGNVNDTVVDSFNVVMPPPAKVTLVTISPSILFNNTIYVGTGSTKFNITFDKNMDMSVKPNVTFGLSPIIIDDGDLGYDDTGWNIAPPNGPAQGYNNHVRWKNRNGTGYAVWKPNVSGSHNVYVSWTIDSNRPTNANYTVYYNTNNSYNFTIDQTKFPNGTASTSSDWSGWYYVGPFNFNSGNVTLWDDANDSKVLIADAVKFESTKKNSVIGNWVNSTLWSGTYPITNSTGDGNNTLNITGAKDSIGRIVAENTSTWFMIGTAPKFATLIIWPSVANTYVKAGNITFTIIFSQPMNQIVNPTVTFGQSSPFNMYTINGSWVNGTIWVGYYNITPSMSNRWYTISISGAQDFMGSVIPQDTSYRFLVDTRPPRVWDVQTSNITFEENETISVKVNDPKPAAEESSGIDTVLVELNGSVNYTMNFGYKITYIGSADYVYYSIINNTQFGNGTQNLKFYVNDTAGNVNSNATGSFYVNSTIPKIGGNIAFLCKNYLSGNMCYDDIEDELISWLRSEGWTVTVNTYYKWNKTGLSGYDLMMCSDEMYACNYGTNNMGDVYYMHKTMKKPFVEISDDGSLRAANNFGYDSYPGGYLRNNVNSLYVTTSHSITSGYFGSTRIFGTNKTMTYTTDIILNGVKDIADIEVENGRSTLFSNDQPGRFVYVGWFYKNFSNLTVIGNTTLSRAISWAQCGNAKGCDSDPSSPITTTSTIPSTTTTVPTTTTIASTTTTPSSTTTISTTTTLPVTTTIPSTCNAACISYGYSSGNCKLSCGILENELTVFHCPTFMYWQTKCCCRT